MVAALHSLGGGRTTVPLTCPHDRRETTETSTMTIRNSVTLVSLYDVALHTHT